VSAKVHAQVSKLRQHPWLGSAAALAATGLLVLSGCGSSSSSSNSTPASTPSTGATTSAATGASGATSTSTTPAAPTGASSGAGGETVKLAANTEGQLEYTTKSLSAKAGSVTIAFTNTAPISHNVNVESASGEQLGATESFSGGTKNLTLNLKPGTYKFFCSVPGHRQAGMEGTLTVK
jgi:plastocyanin